MEMSSTSRIETGPSGTVAFVGPDATNLVRAITVKHGLSLYAKCGMILTRGVTITKLLTIATGYTGRAYKRGQAEVAAADMDQWIETARQSLPVVAVR